MRMIDKLIFIATSSGVESWLFWISFSFVSYIIWEAAHSAMRLIASRNFKFKKVVLAIVFIAFFPLYGFRTVVRFFIRLATSVSRKAENLDLIQDVIWRVDGKTELKITDFLRKPDIIDDIITKVALLCASFLLFQQATSDIELRAKDAHFRHSVVVQEMRDFDEMQKELAENVTVYTTHSGLKYHQKNCRYMPNGGQPVTLREAVEAGYEPCSKCY